MSVIVIAHSKGGVGKSLIAWNLAIVRNAPILDLDYQKSLVFANTFRTNNNHQALEIIHENKDIIVDVGGFDSSTNRVALYVADIIITPVNEDMQEIAGLMKFHATLEELSSQMKEKIKAHILINNVNPNTKDFTIVKDMVAQHTLYQKLDTVVARRADFSKAMKEGLGITEFKRDNTNKAKISILTLSQEIDSHLKKLENN